MLTLALACDGAGVGRVGAGGGIVKTHISMACVHPPPALLTLLTLALTQSLTCDHVPHVHPVVSRPAVDQALPGRELRAAGSNAHKVAGGEKGTAPCPLPSPPNPQPPWTMCKS
jgi:hypothetical protein